MDDGASAAAAQEDASHLCLVSTMFCMSCTRSVVMSTPAAGALREARRKSTRAAAIC